MQRVRNRLRSARVSSAPGISDSEMSIRFGIAERLVLLLVIKMIETSRSIKMDNLLETLEISELELKRYALRAEKNYHELHRLKKSGKTRRVVAPSAELKGLQRKISRRILRHHDLQDSCTGYRPGHSIVTNARPHTGKRFVLNIDLKDFFPSISFNRVVGLYQNLGMDRNAARLLARATTYKGALPQGAPTSPDIANLVCRTLDKRLEGFCKIRQWSYTRYCDDITISGDTCTDGAMDTLRTIIESEGFRINEDKTRMRMSHQRQTVTGVVDNERPNLEISERRKLRTICHQLRWNPESFEGLGKKLMGSLSFANMIGGLLRKSEFQSAWRLLKKKHHEARHASTT